MDELNLILLASRWLHIAAAVVAVGGTVFMRLALLPAIAASLDEAAAMRLRETVRARWAKIVSACIGVLLLTGGFNFVMLALPPKISPMPYHAIFGVKVLMALGLFFIASALTGRSPTFAAIRARTRGWLTFAMILAGLIILVSGVLNQIRAAQERGGVSSIVR